jgi:hypothetical protein
VPSELFTDTPKFLRGNNLCKNSQRQETPSISLQRSKGEVTGKQLGRQEAARGPMLAAANAYCKAVQRSIRSRPIHCAQLDTVAIAIKTTNQALFTKFNEQKCLPLHSLALSISTLSAFDYQRGTYHPPLRSSNA